MISFRRSLTADSGHPEVSEVVPPSHGFVDRIALRMAWRTEGRGTAKSIDGPAESAGLGHNRRSFLARVTVGASALTVDPLRFLLEPVSAWDAVCGSENTCGEGWSVFCCTINNGSNTCPSGSFVAGWWKSDNSSFCGGGPRYIIDCNQLANVACSCGCPTNSCDNRRTCCNQFRYGQCHQEIVQYGPVRCRIVSCVPPWEVDATCTTASATDNRTSDHNAPCNDYSPPKPPAPPPPGAMPSSGPVAVNNDGRIEAFGIGAVGNMLQNCYQYEIGRGWSVWGPIGGSWPVPTSISVGRNVSGSLQVFVRGADGHIRTTLQGPIGTGWSAFSSIGSGLVSAPAVARNLDGRLEVFAVGTDGKLKHSWQNTPGGSWFGFVDFGGSFSNEPAIGTTIDGRMFAVAVGTDGKLYGVAQTSPNGVWTPLVVIGGSHQGRPAIGRNRDGSLVIACLDSTGALVIYRQSGFGWIAAQTLATPMAQSVCMGANADGRLEAFSVDAAGVMHHAWQPSPNGTFGGWSAYPLPAGTSYAGPPAVIANPDGRLEVFARGADGHLWHDYQRSPNSSWAGPSHLSGNLAS